MDTLQLDNALNALILQGKNSEAFLKYYDENVVAQENDEPERKGREQWMRSFEEIAKNIEKYDARVVANAANGDVSFSEWESDAVIKGMGAMRMVQVAVRRWKNGRVVRERFYHKT
jgi:ketosteroid isomerase-like protein